MLKWLDKWLGKQKEQFEKDSRNNPSHVASECLLYQSSAMDVSRWQLTAEIYSRLLKNEQQLGKSTLEEISEFLEGFERHEKIYQNAVEISRRNPEHIGQAWEHTLNQTWTYFVSTHGELTEDRKKYTQTKE